MRHQKSGRHLNRTAAHRKAMLSNMSASLIEHETIKTTVVKAKELRRYVEPLITLSKVDSVANRRRAFAKLRDKAAVGKLFTELGPRFRERPGGYTRILKAGFRQGDSAMVAYMQLLDQPDMAGTQQPEPLFTEDQDAEDEVETPVAEAEESAAATETSATSEEDATEQETVAAEASEDVTEAEAESESSAEAEKEEPKSKT